MNEASPATPKVSVLMSVFNERRDLLEAAIDSIRRQTFRNFELVIMDDESTSPETVRALERAAEHDSRIRLFREPHGGLTRMLNIGLSRCRGEYVCRHDSDDWSEPNRIELQLAFLELHREVAIVGTQVQFHQLSGRPLWRSHLPLTSKEILEFFPSGNPFAHGSVCFRRDAMSAVGGYREIFRCSQDYDCFWRLSERYAGANLPDALYHYRFTGASVSARRYRDQTLTVLVARHIAKERAEGRTEDVAAAYRDAEASLPIAETDFLTMIRAADHLLLAGSPRGAFPAFVRALRLRPLNLRAWLALSRGILFTTAPRLRARLFRQE